MHVSYCFAADTFYQCYISMTAEGHFLRRKSGIYTFQDLPNAIDISSFYPWQQRPDYLFSSGHTSYQNVSFIFTNLVHLPSATLFTAAKSSSDNVTNFALLLILLSLLLFGSTEYPLFNPHAISTCASVQPFFSATAVNSLFVLTFSPVPGTWSWEPRGE